jgi:hypothetical protein
MNTAQTARGESLNLRLPLATGWILGLLLAQALPEAHAARHAPLQRNPAWWTTHGTLRPEASPDDFAIANRGQFRHFLEGAVRAIVDHAPPARRAEVPKLAATWRDFGENAVDDYAPVSQSGALEALRQLRAEAKLLGVELRARSEFPECPVPTPQDYVPLVLGQVKALFDWTPVRRIPAPSTGRKVNGL